MSNLLVFDIETYRPNWRDESLSRREQFNPAHHQLTVIGVYDGEEIQISPIAKSISEEPKLLQWFNTTAKNQQLVGYNIFKFDVPVLVYRSYKYNLEIDTLGWKARDLYWLFPAWLEFTPTGKNFQQKYSDFGKLWSLEKITNYLLKNDQNPVPQKEVLHLYEKKQYQRIKKHLEHDLLQTYALLESKQLQEIIDYLKCNQPNPTLCNKKCPFWRFYSVNIDTAVPYCTLLDQPVDKPVPVSPIECTSQPLPSWGTRFNINCLET